MLTLLTARHRATKSRTPVYGVGAVTDAFQAGRRIDAIVALRADSSEIFTTSPVRGA